MEHRVGVVCHFIAVVRGVELLIWIGRAHPRGFRLDAMQTVEQGVVVIITRRMSLGVEARGRWGVIWGVGAHAACVVVHCKDFSMMAM